jgi:ABC-2 type transport system permease protein
MRDLLTLSRAILLGFRRDKVGLFFTILFPLIFLIVIGGIFHTNGVPKFKLVEVGSVGVLDNLPASARAQIDPVLTITRTMNAADALGQVRDGDAAALIQQQGGHVTLRYSAADAMSAGTIRSVILSLVQQANLTATAQPAQFSLASTQVEDNSLKQIQYLTPGILGWAIATGATFGASATLVGWRQKRLLRRLSLCPINSIGLLAGAKAKSGETANAITNLIVIPMAFLSGSFFPLSLAPAWLQGVSQILPLRHLNDGMLSVLARGTGIVRALPQFGVLLAFAAAFTLLATRLFSWDDV